MGFCVVENFVQVAVLAHSFSNAYGPSRIRVFEYGLKQNTAASRNGEGGACAAGAKGGACADAALWLDVVEIVHDD